MTLKPPCPTQVPTFDAQSRYAMHRALQVALRASGRDADAAALGHAMDTQALKALQPVARATLRGRMVAFDNKIPGSRSSRASSSSDVRALAEAASHRFVFAALPLDFQDTASRDAMETSLVHHGEKKALAALLRAEEDSDSEPSRNERDRGGPLAVDINFKMCADCHAFFKACSAKLDRQLHVREPSTVHVFQGGACSCKGAWRWEARHPAPGATR